MRPLCHHSPWGKSGTKLKFDREFGQLRADQTSGDRGKAKQTDEGKQPGMAVEVGKGPAQRAHDDSKLEIAQQTQCEGSVVVSRFNELETHERLAYREFESCLADIDYRHRDNYPPEVFRREDSGESHHRPEIDYEGQKPRTNQPCSPYRDATC